jgi:hypothetical protein
MMRILNFSAKKGVNSDTKTLIRIIKNCKNKIYLKR